MNTTSPAISPTASSVGSTAAGISSNIYSGGVNLRDYSNSESHLSSHLSSNSMGPSTTLSLPSHSGHFVNSLQTSSRDSHISYDQPPQHPQNTSHHPPYLHSSSSSSASNYLHTSGEEDEGMKLFIGQIPKHLDEDALRPFFDEFGPIVELTVIRDKNTKAHRGCAFLTYALRQSAIRAIQALHDKVKLPNSLNPLQIRPAESHSEKENKIFVGMLPKSVSEGELHDMFSPYGQLKEIHIIRGPEGQSKGCAFVKFVDRDAATAAIEDLNDRIPEGSARPLVIKFADSKKMRDGDDYLMGANSEQYWGQRSEFDVDPSYLSQYVNDTFGSPETSYYEEEPPRHLHSMSSSNLNRLAGPPIPQVRPQSVPPPSSSRDKNNSRPAEGPMGANLFIYHLPRDLTDADLATLFAPFGNVISAKVFVDKKTDESKGFGFVSYNSVGAAESAIEAMNGFQIGSKRLKVQHKRVGVDPRAMGMPQAMSNYGPPLNYFPNQPPPTQQHNIYPPQYHGRMPPMREADVYLDQELPYDPYVRERDPRYGEYHYPSPQEPPQRYQSRVPSYYPEEVRYSQPPTREHHMYGPPSSGRQTHSHQGYVPEYYDNGFETQFEHSMRFHGGEM